MEHVPVPVQLLRPPAYSYYKAPYPILSFMYGLYCDDAWSAAEFRKWEDSETAADVYEYEAYLDPYPNMPHGARQLISVTVPAEAEPAEDGRLLPNRPLAERMWPYLVQELTFDPSQAVSAPSDPGRKLPVRDSNRPALSGLSLIYLTDLNEQGARQAFTEYASPLKEKLVAVAVARPGLGAPLNTALLALKEDLLLDFTSPPGPW